MGVYFKTKITRFQLPTVPIDRLKEKAYQDDVFNQQGNAFMIYLADVFNLENLYYFINII